MLNIVIPMAGRGSRFQAAGYTFPKPLIDIKGKTMIEVAVDNLRPKCEHKFIFICQKEHCEKYDLYHILQNASKNKFEIVQVDGDHGGAACAVLLASRLINNDVDDLLIANADQFIEIDINDFIAKGRKPGIDGLIMTFSCAHPKWSYARTDKNGKVIETAEKRLISNNATVGIYYFKSGKKFVDGAQAMIKKNIRTNNEFYVCPVYNEMILADDNVGIYNISAEQMHGLGTPEDLNQYLSYLDNKNRQDGGNKKVS
ncbi:MAG: glycosyltransferase family 2 protein [Patescibacteria group bacterium]|nr:glycosyltransferase family 2 protein [Patescibacteria group bacterium]